MKSKCINALISLIIIAAVSFGCNFKETHKGADGISDPTMEEVAVSDSLTRGIYHWKTTFNLSDDDLAFVKEHGINQLYVRMFDVGLTSESMPSSMDNIIPLGTTKFLSHVPEGCRVIPTVYISLSALKAFSGQEKELADMIVKRIFAMASWNDLGEIDEIQYDCDWTANTRPMFERLCEHTRAQLREKGVILSGTIRLHQIQEAYYPFDKGVVMIYNTGSLYDSKGKNSILSYDDVYKYLSVESRIKKFREARTENCPVMEMAYPTYGWGVVYTSMGKFKRLVSSPEAYEASRSDMWDERVRWETSEIDEIIRVKRLVDNTIGKVSQGNIIYHLDSKNLLNYESDEIENIYK